MKLKFCPTCRTLVWKPRCIMYRHTTHPTQWCAHLTRGRAHERHVWSHLIALGEGVAYAGSKTLTSLRTSTYHGPRTFSNIRSALTLGYRQASLFQNNIATTCIFYKKILRRCCYMPIVKTGEEISLWILLHYWWMIYVLVAMLCAY
jgi:hypothetical protein